MAKPTARGRKAGRGVGLALTALALGGCLGEGNQSPGFDPPNASFHFPAGMLLDPRIDDTPGEVCTLDEECGAGAQCAAGVCRNAPRWMFITNANSDLRFNAGTMVALDLDAVFDAIADPAEPGTRLTESQPCRRNQLQPSIPECEESYFVEADATIRMGQFGAAPVGWTCEVEDAEGVVTEPDICKGEDKAMVLVPVRSDPSVTYAIVSGGLEGGDDIAFECGQKSGDPRRCTDAYQLRRQRNDPEGAKLGREPFNVMVSPDPRFPLAFVAHQTDDDLSLIKLDGLVAKEEADGRPALVDRRELGAPGGARAGWFGLAQRPCSLDNASALSRGCTVPLVYAAYRFSRTITTLTAQGLTDEEIGPNRTCVAPGDLGDEEGAVVCEPTMDFSRLFFSGGLDTGAVPASVPVLGGMDFASDGDELFIVQSNPGSLIRYDTSLDFFDNPRNQANATVELCARPTSFALYEDAEGRYGLATCYRSAELFIVDLESMQLAAIVRPGTGPNAVTVDLAREVAYVANSLDATISIVDMSRDSSTRFSELGRIGLTEPYTQ